MGAVGTPELPYNGIVYAKARYLALRMETPCMILLVPDVPKPNDDLIVRFTVSCQ